LIIGHGDDIMATAYARAAVEHFHNQEKPIAVKCVFGNPETFHNKVNNTLAVHTSEVFRNNPYCLQPGDDHPNIVCIPDYPGARVSIDYENSVWESIDRGAYSERVIRQFKFDPNFRAKAGDLIFDQDELGNAMRFVSRNLPPEFYVIEPCGKRDYHSNKLWPFNRWQEFIYDVPDNVTFVQFKHNAEDLDLADGDHAKIHRVEGSTFREACAIMQVGKRGYVGTDGGLHHAAAAMDLPALVLWGHYSSPANFGYFGHVNIQGKAMDAGGSWIAGPCGNLRNCDICTESMQSIPVKEVVSNWKALNDAR